MKKLSLLFTVLAVALLALPSFAQDQTVTKTTWGAVKAKYRTSVPAEMDRDAVRASELLKLENPTQEDLAWMESMAPEYRQQLMKKLTGIHRDPMNSIASTGRPHAPFATTATWYKEFIEKRTGGGVGCRPTGFWNDAGQCGGEFPYDKVYWFPCSNFSNRGALKIVSSSWQVNWMLGSGVDARVYADHIEVCIGYWSLYFTGVNPYSLLSNTYVYW